ncbi:MAG: hypothetical protein ACPGUY_06405 [Akkermansiaceae bacterium]
MIILGVAGSDKQLREKFSAQLVLGRLGMDWAFGDSDASEIRDRLAACLPTNFVVFSDVSHEWQADLVRRCGGMVIHLETEDCCGGILSVQGFDVTLPITDSNPQVKVPPGEFLEWCGWCELFEVESLKDYCGNSSPSC